MTWWGWIIAGAILLGAELAFVNAQFYLVFLGSAAILTGLATLLLPLAAWLQWALFAVLAIVSMVTFRSRVYQRFNRALPQVGTGPAGGLITLQVPLGAGEIEQFLTHLAVQRRVSAATQNQALQALLFIYRHVLDIELPWLDNITRATHEKKLPVVLTRQEVRALLVELQGTPWLVASLLYGSGLRLMEAMRLRVKDLALERGEVIVREGSRAAQ